MNRKNKMNKTEHAYVEQLQGILGGAASDRKSREASAVERALGEPMSGVYGGLIRQCHSCANYRISINDASENNKCRCQ